MPTFKIKGTDIFHSTKLYPDGSTIELKKEDSDRLADYLELIPGTETPKKEEIKQVKPARDRSYQSKPVKQAEVAEPQPQKEPETIPVTGTTTVQAETATPPVTITEVKTKTATQVPPAAQKVIANAIAQANNNIHNTSSQFKPIYQPSAPTNMREA